MCSVSFADILFDKLLSFSSKMKETSFKQGSSMYLVDDNHNLFDHFTGQFCNYIAGSDISDISLSDFVFNKSPQPSKVEHSLVKNFSNSYLTSNKLNFSPHLFNVVNDSLRYLKQSDFLLSVSSSANIANMLCELSFIEPSHVEISSSNYETEPTSNGSMPTTNTTEQTDIKMSVTVRSGKKKTTLTSEKLNVANGFTLNLELANRKTKELQKRSKKRRRRQKRGRRDKVPDDNAKLSSPKSSQPCISHSSENDSQFIVTVQQQVHMAPSFTSQFVIQVAGLSDDDSDWDTFSGNDLFAESAEFELAGLVVANLTAQKSCFEQSHSLNFECSFASYNDEEAEELSKMEAVLLEVNRDWDERTKDIAGEPKLPTKVSFASEEQLVEVLPVDVCDRKGEWEVYATERLRFKRRISELEKVIAPCLTRNHRSKIYNKFIQDTL